MQDVHPIGLVFVIARAALGVGIHADVPTSGAIQKAQAFGLRRYAVGQCCPVRLEYQHGLAAQREGPPRRPWQVRIQTIGVGPVALEGLARRAPVRCGRGIALQLRGAEHLLEILRIQSHAHRVDARDQLTMAAELAQLLLFGGRTRGETHRAAAHEDKGRGADRRRRQKDRAALHAQLEVLKAQGPSIRSVSLRGQREMNKALSLPDGLARRDLPARSGRSQPVAALLQNPGWFLDAERARIQEHRRAVCSFRDHAAGLQ